MHKYSTPPVSGNLLDGRYCPNKDTIDFHLGYTVTEETFTIILKERLSSVLR